MRWVGTSEEAMTATLRLPTPYFHGAKLHLLVCIVQLAMINFDTRQFCVVSPTHMGLQMTIFFR